MDRKRSSRGEKFRLIIGIIIAVIGSIHFVTGGVGFYLDVSNSDPDGYHPSEVYEIRSDSCAFFLPHLPSNIGLPDPRTVWIVEPIDPEKELFVGWTYYSNITKYETSLPFETPENWEWYYSPYSSTIDIPDTNVWNQNSPNATPPEQEQFWIDHVTSNGSMIRLKWDAKWEPKDQLRTLVIMNSDGSRNVSADITFGSRIPLFQIIHYPLMSLGVILMIIGIVLMIKKRK